MEVEHDDLADRVEHLRTDILTDRKTAKGNVAELEAKLCDLQGHLDQYIQEENINATEAQSKAEEEFEADVTLAKMRHNIDSLTQVLGCAIDRNRLMVLPGNLSLKELLAIEERRSYYGRMDARDDRKSGARAQAEKEATEQYK